jgi:hypothetical protein
MLYLQSWDTVEFVTSKINSTNSVAFLDIIIESSLIWKECKANLVRLLGLLHQTCIRIENSQIYISYIHSVLNYGLMQFHT